MTMQAYVYHRYGTPEVLQKTTLPIPVPGPGEVLVRVKATSINAADWHLLTADIFLVRLNAGFWTPRIRVLGCDVAGEVAGMGEGASRFKTGDRVFGMVFRGGNGAFAEHVCVPEDHLAFQPSCLSHEACAAVPLAAVTALQALRDRGNLQQGQRVLIQGASGGVGTFAVQLARHLGAEVTAVCSTRNVERVKGLGAHRVLDYQQGEFVQPGELFDLIVGINGHRPLSTYLRHLTQQGRYVMVGGTKKQLFEALLLGPWQGGKQGKRVQVLTLSPLTGELDLLRDLLQNGSLRPVLDQGFSFDDLPAAMVRFGEGRTQGKIVVSLEKTADERHQTDRESAGSRF